MKQISDELSDRLARETLTLCLCWRLRRQDGVEIGLTDHDAALSLGGVSFEPGGALEAGRFVQSEGLKPGIASGAGILSSNAISEADLADGIWDRCRVDVFQVDWQVPEVGTRHVWSGYLSEIQVSETGVFEAELVSLKTDLERPVGRVLQRNCDAVLGDARCGIVAAGRVCDQRFETCRDLFSNTENFRGFPHMPGNDFVLSGPAASGNDGGQR